MPVRGRARVPAMSVNVEEQSHLASIWNKQSLVPLAAKPCAGVLSHSRIAPSCYYAPEPRNTRGTLTLCSRCLQPTVLLLRPLCLLAYRPSTPTRQRLPLSYVHDPMSLKGLQLSLLPAAIGVSAVVFSNIQCMTVLGELRYSDGQKVHPYRPWADKAATADPHFRGYKACMNVLEWTVYYVPMLFLYVIYTPALPVVGRVTIPGTPDLLLLPWCGAVGGLAFANLNVKYVKGYMNSVEGRLKPFYRRTNVFKLTVYLTFAGIAASVADVAGLLTRFQ